MRRKNVTRWGQEMTNKKDPNDSRNHKYSTLSLYIHWKHPLIEANGIGKITPRSLNQGWLHKIWNQRNR